MWLIPFVDELQCNYLAKKNPLRHKSPAPQKIKTRGVSHFGLAIYIKKYLKAKGEIWKLKYFTMQNYNLQKIL
jgi:hypothetical protein